MGPFLSNSSISGKVPGYEGLYNFYNIGATSSNEPMGAIKNGLAYARDGKGASEETKAKYLLPWNTKERAITGGAIFIGSSYINVGQNNLYLQKFHVTSNSSQELFWHQYMTNVLAPYSESSSIYSGYSSTGILNNSMTFIIPVYNNMPETLCQNPNILESDFIDDNTRVYADVQNTLNIRTGPSTSYESLIQIDRNVIMTRIAKGRQAGELWDKVLLPNGMVGYAFSNYLKEAPKVQIESITLSVENEKMKKGDTQKVAISILPEEAQNHEISYESSKPNVASIDEKGNIVALSSGTTVITAKAKENNVTASITIQVYTPITDMQVNSESIVLQEGNTFVITPIFTPVDADIQNVIYTSEKPEIASVDRDGKVTAEQKGNTKIIVQTEDKQFTKEVHVTVVPKLQEGEIIFDENLRIEQNIISGWNLEEMTVKQIKEKIQTSYTIKIFNYEGKELEEDQRVGTGGKIQFVDENNVTKMEYYILIYGDVSGDAKINSIDLLQVQRHILELERLQGIFYLAGGTSKNGRNPTSFDMLKIQRHILELQEIEQ